MATYPPNCGERFAYLVPTPCEGGFGLGITCAPSDLDRAWALLVKLHDTLLNSWNDIMDVENQRGSHPVTQAWRAEHDAWDARYHELVDQVGDWKPSTYFILREGKAFDEVVAIARDGACLLDAMLADGARYEEIVVPSAPYQPPPPAGPWDALTDAGRSAVSIAVVAALGFVAYKVWQRYG